MSEHLVHLDEAALAAAMAQAGTDDVAEAVNLALRTYAARPGGGPAGPAVSPGVRDGLDLLESGALEDALDPAVARASWR